MNGYWKRDEVSIAEAMEMAKMLWLSCDRDIREHDRYWERGGNAKMDLGGYPGARVTVYFSPWMHRSCVVIERRGLKESMTYSPRMGLLEADFGWLSRYGAWRYEPSCGDGADDLRRACVSALEGYRASIMATGKEAD